MQNSAYVRCGRRCAAVWPPTTVVNCARVCSCDVRDAIMRNDNRGLRCLRVGLSTQWHTHTHTCGYVRTAPAQNETYHHHQWQQQNGRKCCAFRLLCVCLDDAAAATGSDYRGHFLCHYYTARHCIAVTHIVVYRIVVIITSVLICCSLLRARDYKRDPHAAYI